MASKRSPLDQNASSAKKKPKRLCSFSSSWISEEFEVTGTSKTKFDIVSCCCIYVYYIIKQEFLLAIASQNHSMIIIGLYYMLVAFHDLAVQQPVITF